MGHMIAENRELAFIWFVDHDRALAATNQKVVLELQGVVTFTDRNGLRLKELVVNGQVDCLLRQQVMLVHNVVDRRLVLDDNQLISAIIDNDVLVVFGGALTRHLLLDLKLI